MIPGREYSVSSFLQLLRNYLPLLVVLAALGATAGRAYTRGVPDAYRSDAMILVQPQVLPQTFVRSTVTQSLEDRLRTMQERVLASDQLARIASELKVDESVDPDTAARNLANGVRLGITRADTFRVGFVHRDPYMAARVAQRLAQAFIDENLRTRTGLADETEQFMNGQLERTRDQLAENESKLEEYRRTYAGQLPSQLSANLQVIQNAQAQLRSIEAALQQDRDRKLKLEQTIASLAANDDPVPTDPSSTDTASKDPADDIDPFKDQVLELRGREALSQLPRLRRTLQALQLQLKPDHPDIIRLKRVIDQLEQRVIADLGPNAMDRDVATAQLRDQQRARNLEQLHAEASAVDARLAKREAEERRVDQQAQEYQRRVELIPSRETELTTLMRDYDTLRETYRGLLAKKQEAQMASELERQSVGESFEIIESARVPTRPFSPNRLRFVLEGAGFGLAIGLLFTGWREYRNDTLRTEREIANGLGVPVIALLPVLPKNRRFFRSGSPSENPSESSLDHYRALALRLSRAEPQEPHHVVLVTSALAGEGKTLTATNLALMLSGSFGKRVLVVDGDLRKPAIHTALPLQPLSAPNVVERYAKPSEATMGMTLLGVNSNLLAYTWPDGAPDDPVKTLTLPHLRLLLEWAKTEFDWILIDSPPALMPETSVLAQLADGVLFVVSTGATPFEAARRAIESVGRSRILGIAMNRVPETGVDNALKYYRNS